MGFSERQAQALKRTVPPRHIRTRIRDGRELSYVEGWFVIAEANRIFGFDGWDRETLEAKCVLGRETRGVFLAVYTAKVRLTIRTQDRTTTVREGHGTGEGRGNSVGEAHDVAIKAAETDATKRALVTFGNAFGLTLYGQARGKREVQSGDADQMMQGKAGKGSATRPSPGLDGEDANPWPGSDGVPGPRDTLDGAAVPAAEAATITGPEAPFVPTSENGIDKSALALSEPRRVRDKAHLRYVAAQPCVLCNARPADPHHIRFAQPRALGRKVGDEYTVPLCRRHHREVHHSGNEAAWWHDMGIDAISVAQELWNATLARRSLPMPLRREARANA